MTKAQAYTVTPTSRALAIAIAIIFGFALFVTPTMAQGDPVLRGWIKGDASQFMLVMEMDAGDAGTASLLYRMFNDPDMLEDQLDVEVIASVDMSRRDTRSLGVEEATVYEIDFEQTMPGTMIVTYEGSTLYVLMLVALDDTVAMDTDVFDDVTEEVIDRGLDRAKGPDGWIEQDISDL